MRKIIFLGILVSLILINTTNFIYSQNVSSPVEPFSFIYEEKTDESTGETFVVRMAYPYSVKQQKDEEAINKILDEMKGRQAQQNVDLKSLAAWRYFNDQLELWQKYVGEVVFRKDLNVDIKEMKWKDKESTQQELDEIFKNLQNQAQEISTWQKDEVVKIANDLDERADKRVSYLEWQKEVKKNLEEFADGWISRKSGKVITLDGYHFLISDKPLDRLPREHYNIVSPTGFITPYDFLNPDGTYKQPKE